MTVSVQLRLIDTPSTFQNTRYRNSNSPSILPAQLTVIYKRVPLIGITVFHHSSFNLPPFIERPYKPNPVACCYIREGRSEAKKNKNTTLGGCVQQRHQRIKTSLSALCRLCPWAGVDHASRPTAASIYTQYLSLGNSWMARLTSDLRYPYRRHVLYHA